jgi:hypothetical protein
MGTEETNPATAVKQKAKPQAKLVRYADSAFFRTRQLHKKQAKTAILLDC